MSDIDRVFVSYSRRDQEIVFRLVSDLASQGIGVWIDQRDISPGEIWEDAINQALDRYGYLLIILSPHSVSSTYIWDEVSRAMIHGTSLFAALIDNCEIPYEFHQIPLIDFRVRYAQAVIDLAKAMSASGYPVQVPIGTAEEVEANTNPYPSGFYNQKVWVLPHAFRVVHMSLPPHFRKKLTTDNLDAITQAEIDYYHYYQDTEPDIEAVDYIREQTLKQGFNLSVEFIEKVLAGNDVYLRLLGIIQDED